MKCINVWFERSSQSEETHKSSNKWLVVMHQPPKKDQQQIPNKSPGSRRLCDWLVLLLRKRRKFTRSCVHFDAPATDR